jgi:hypothetical protein
LIVGTVMGGSLAAESLPTPFTVLDALGLVVALATIAGVGCAASAVGGPSGEIVWPIGDGVASLLAAQANEVMTAAGRIEKYLLNNVELISR